jgi:hypothetical protein
VIKWIILFTLLINTTLAQENADAFIVTIKDDRIRVVSPKEKSNLIGVIITNETFEKIVSEVRSDQGVIQRFVLAPQGSTSLQVNFSNIKSLFYVSVAPPFQAVELKFSQRAYEIPEKE